MSADQSSPFDAIFEGGTIDPMEAAQRSMRADLPKVFWTSVTIEQSGDRYGIALDGRPARTPGRNPLVTSSPAIAEAMRDEWAALETFVDPLALPVTRLINVAIDRAETLREAILADAAAYAENDLLCYRADTPAGLVARQEEIWGPYLAWLEEHASVRLSLVEGVMPAKQDPDDLARFAAAFGAAGSTGEAAAALHLATSLTGSAVLALALGVGFASGEDVWAAAHVDEDWNRELWGEDAEATRLRTVKKRDFDAAALVLEAHRQT
ncbi:MAG: ATPase [Devosiaceae bacterium]|nr:ATPase [Devosiaceae bacterium MH13]